MSVKASGSLAMVLIAVLAFSVYGPAQERKVRCAPGDLGRQDGRRLPRVRLRVLDEGR
ncbi:MAG: hypothetical protein M0C28_21065 [Candidatus Moduliflexus flocculans]|nr:hypothetical protein [Candidatus Moduliflexus flocculans]